MTGFSSDAVCERREPGFGVRTCDDGDRQRFRGPAAEREAEHGCQEDRKDENPEYRLGLAGQLANARSRELVEGPANFVFADALSCHAVSVPSGS